LSGFQADEFAAGFPDMGFQYAVGFQADGAGFLDKYRQSALSKFSSR
jgi:hypothetical protein